MQDITNIVLGYIQGLSNFARTWNLTTWFFVILISVWFFSSIFSLENSYRNLRKQIHTLLDALVALGDSPVQTVQQYESLYLLKSAQDNSLTWQLWQKYKKTIMAPQYIESRDRGQSASIVGTASVGFITKPIFSMESSWDYFNVENLWTKSTKERYFQYVPALLVGLGILGTFLGLTMGIHRGMAGIKTSNIIEMRASMRHLLQGASTAFVTSLVGLLGSLWFALRLRRVHRIVEANIFALNEQIETLVPYISFEQMLFLSQKTRAESKELVAGMGRVIRGELTTVMDKLREDNKRQNERLVLALRKIRGVFKNLSSNQVEQIGGLIQEAVQSMSTIFGEELKKMTETFATAAQSITDSAEAVKSIMHRLEESVAKTSKRLQTTTEETTQTLKDSVKESTRAVNRSVRLLDAKLTQVTTSMIVVARKSEDIQARITKTATTVQESVDQARRSFIEVMQEGSKTWTRQMMAVPVKANAMMTRSINESTQALSRAWSNASHVATRNFTASLTQAGEDFAKTCIRPIKTVVQAIEPLVKEIKGHRENSALLMETMKKLLRTFKDMDGNMGESLEQLIEAMRENQRSVRKMTGLMDAFGRSVSNILTIQDNLKGSISLIQKTHSDVARLLNTLHNVTKEQLVGISKVLNAQNDSLRKNMTTMDTNLSSALQQMSATLKSWIRQQNQATNSYKRTMGKMKQTLDAVGKKIDRLA